MCDKNGIGYLRMTMGARPPGAMLLAVTIDICAAFAGNAMKIDDAMTDGNVQRTEIAKAWL
jgi:hypothetical protein